MLELEIKMDKDQPYVDSLWNDAENNYETLNQTINSEEAEIFEDSKFHKFLWGSKKQ